MPFSREEAASVLQVVAGNKWFFFSRQPFKGAQVWAFRSLGFSWFLHHKVFFLGGGATLGLNLKKEAFLYEFGPKKIFSWSFWDHLLMLFFFFCFRYFNNYWTFWLPFAHDPTLMCTLSKQVRDWCVRIRNWCAPSLYASVPYTHAQLAHQFFQFSNVHFIYAQHARKELMHALSMCVKNWCVLWACTVGTDAYTEHTSQELVRALSIHIRN